MKVQSRKVTWTNLELDGLLEDEDSHVHFTRTIKHLALHPYHLNNVQRGLNQILRSSLNSYDRELKGFVLAFKNPKLLSNLGEMLYDSPFIHVDVEADFYLFRPTIGSFIKGMVKKKGLDHIVVLMHKIYTVSIPKPDDVEEWAGDLVEIGQEVRCCVNHIDNRSKPPFICATLKSDYLQGCRLPDSINNIDNVDSAIESINSTMKLEVSANGVSEENDISEKERKKHRKKHKKSCEDSTNFVYKVENKSESQDNLENDISTTIKSERKSKQYQSMQDATLSTDDSSNNLEINKKYKKSKKTSKSFSDDTILDKHTESRKTVKRENSISLDSIAETETKKRKKHAKKSREFDSNSNSENEEKVINNTKNNILSCIKSEEQEGKQHKKNIILNANLSSNDLEDSVSKKRKKNKKTSMKMSESESEDHVVKIKIEKPDPFIDKIYRQPINESQISYSETQIAQNVNENFKTSKFLKKEVSIEYDSLEKEGKKSPKKHTITSRNSQSKLIKIKTEDDMINDVIDTLDKEKKKSSKKHAKDSDSEIRIKSESITNDLNIISRTIKRDPEEFQDMNYNISVTDNSLSNSDLDYVSKKSKKKKMSSILSDSELKYPEKLVKVKIEKI